MSVWVDEEEILSTKSYPPSLAARATADKNPKQIQITKIPPVFAKATPWQDFQNNIRHAQEYLSMPPDFISNKGSIYKRSYRTDFEGKWPEEKSKLEQLIKYFHIMKSYQKTLAILCLLMLFFSCHDSRVKDDRNRIQSNPGPTEVQLESIRTSKKKDKFVLSKSGAEFLAWGVNYDRDDGGRLLEDYWLKEWATVVEDFKEIKGLGANVVRVHLQIAKFMKTSKELDQTSLKQLTRLVKLAEETGLYLDITGLGCYHKDEVPGWYKAMDEAQRWNVQARFWEEIAKTCADSPAIFCYDLMNEPIIPGKGEKQKEWLTGELAGKYYVQRIALDLAGRTQKQVARAWVDKLVAAIRKYDKEHLITVGVIPWAYSFFPKVKEPLFYAREVGDNLDFVSVHFYPKKGEIDKALKALAVYDIGKPLVIEELFPLWCSQEEMEVFIDGSRKIAEGWISFYWGKTINEYAEDKDNPTSVLINNWLKYFQKKSTEITGK